MNTDIYNQFYNLIIFFLIGIIIGMLFDIFRGIRKAFKTPDIITYIEDILFWILVGSIILFSIFFFNNGEIRGYIFIGLFVGLIIYILTISKYFVIVNVKILTSLKKIVYLPIKIIYHFINKRIANPIKNITKKVKELVEKILKRTTKNVMKHEIIDNREKM